MSDNHGDKFAKIEQLLLRLTLLALLAISLLKVIAPEIMSLRESFSGGQQSGTAHTQAERTEGRSGTQSNVLPKR